MSHLEIHGTIFLSLKNNIHFDLGGGHTNLNVGKWHGTKYTDTHTHTHTHTHRAIFFLGHLSQINENLHSHKNLSTTVYRNFISNIPPRGNTPNVLQWVYNSINHWIAIPLNHGISLSKKEGANCWHTTTWMDFKGTMLSEKIRLKSSLTIGFHLYNILEMTKLWRWRID